MASNQMHSTMRRQDSEEGVKNVEKAEKSFLGNSTWDQTFPINNLTNA